MDQRGDDAEPREHELHGRIDQPGLDQHGVQESVVAEHHDPRIGAHHLAEEQRGHRDDQDRRLERHPAGAHQRIGERIADEQRHERREKADPHGVEEDPGIERLQQRREVREREAAGLERARHISAQARLQHGGQRREEAGRAQRRRRHERAQERTGVHDGLLKFASTSLGYPEAATAVVDRAIFTDAHPHPHPQPLPTRGRGAHRSCGLMRSNHHQLNS